MPSKWLSSLIVIGSSFLCITVAQAMAPEIKAAYERGYNEGRKSKVCGGSVFQERRNFRTFSGSGTIYQPVPDISMLSAEEQKGVRLLWNPEDKKWSLTEGGVPEPQRNGQALAPADIKMQIEKLQALQKISEDLQR